MSSTRPQRRQRCKWFCLTWRHEKIPNEEIPSEPKAQHQNDLFQSRALLTSLLARAMTSLSWHNSHKAVHDRYVLFRHLAVWNFGVEPWWRASKHEQINRFTMTNCCFKTNRKKKDEAGWEFFLSRTKRELRNHQRLRKRKLLSLLSTPAASVTKKLKFNLELELPLKTKELTRLWLWLAT